MNDSSRDVEVRDQFVRASETGDFLLPRCGECGDWAWPPREICTRCRTLGWHWEPASARGTLLSLARVWRGAGEGFQEEVPYDLALLRLDEGPEFITRAASERLALGAPVRLAWREIADQPWPCAIPAEDPDGGKSDGA